MAMATAVMESRLIWAALVAAISGPPTAAMLTVGISELSAADCSSSHLESFPLSRLSLAPNGLSKVMMPCCPSVVKR